MALTATVTHLWPTLNRDTDFTVSQEVVLFEDEVEVKRQTFSCDVEKEAALEDTAPVITRLLAKINPWIKKWKVENAANKHAAMTAIDNGVQDGLIL